MILVEFLFIWSLDYWWLLLRVFGVWCIRLLFKFWVIDFALRCICVGFGFGLVLVFDCLFLIVWGLRHFCFFCWFTCLIGGFNDVFWLCLFLVFCVSFWVSFVCLICGVLNWWYFRLIFDLNFVMFNWWVWYDIAFVSFAIYFIDLIGVLT